MLVIIFIIGIGLLLSSIFFWFKMKKEVLEGKSVVWINFGPYFGQGNLTEKGNVLRKKYNRVYFLFIVYIAVLFILKNKYGLELG